MRQAIKTVMLMALAAAVLFVSATAREKRQITETFDDISRITIKSVSGDCVIVKGQTDQVTVEVTHSYYPSDSFEPRLKKSGQRLRLSERMHGSNSGRSTWKLTIPDGLQVDFSTASGDLTVTDIEGRFSASTASGNVEMVNCRGEFEISTASGDIVAHKCTGLFELSTASGDVEADGIIVNDESTFSTASGRVDVSLGATAEHNLNLGSASGKALLNYSGHPIRGFFEFEAKRRHGRIDSPIDFDNEETFRKWDDRYVRKTFTKESDSPVIAIHTASGRAVLKER